MMSKLVYLIVQPHSGEWSGIGYIEMGRVADASFIVDECKVTSNTHMPMRQSDMINLSTTLHTVLTTGGTIYTR